jgi:protein tyrosine phosphatase type 4A
MGTKRSSSSPTYFKPAPSEIQYGKMRFLITDRPTDQTIRQFIEELNKHKARAVVRVCEPTYAVDALQSTGISVLDWEFSDGSPPPKEVIDKWLALIKDSFKEHPDQCIAVHCVAGLGRAPVLVALALMEAGMKYEDAVDLIRQNRRGAINQKQLNFLEKYKPTGELRKLKNGTGGGMKNSKNCCLQ